MQTVKNALQTIFRNTFPFSIKILLAMFWYLGGVRENTHSFKEITKNIAQQFRNWIKLDAAAIFKLSLNQIWMSATETFNNHIIYIIVPLTFLPLSLFFLVTEDYWKYQSCKSRTTPL